MGVSDDGLVFEFPQRSEFSRLLPGPERIRENVFVDKPISVPQCGEVHTVYDAMKKGARLSNNGRLFGEQVDGEWTWTNYDSVLRDAQILGSALSALGFSTGESCRIGMAGLHSVRYLTAMHSMVAYGRIVVPLYHNSSIETLCDISERCELALIYCDTDERAAEFLTKHKESALPSLRHIVVLKSNNNWSKEHAIKVSTYEELLTLGEANLIDVQPPTSEMVYFICHTSGTTGTPKGVLVQHKNIIAAMAGLHHQFCEEPNNWGLNSDDVYLSFLPLGHIYEHLMQAFIMYLGASIGIFNGNPAKLLADIQSLRPTILSLVPRLMNRFYEAVHADVAKTGFLSRFIFDLAKRKKIEQLRQGVIRYDTIWDRLVFWKTRQLLGGRIRMLTSGGAPITGAVMEFTRIAYGAQVMEGYGQTECSAGGCLNLPCDTSTGQVGGPAPWAQVKLIDVPEMGHLASEDRGEVCFRGAGVMKGYFNDERLTRETVDEEGWVHTGDIGLWLPNGGLKIVDRKNAIFKLSQGEFVAPEQIETVYLSSPLVKQIYITGDSSKSFLVAVVVADMQQVAAAFPETEDASMEVVNRPATRRKILDSMNAFAREHHLTAIQIVKNIRVVREEFTCESGMLTPLLKLKRHLLKQHFQKEIDDMYSEKF